ncbi:MAG TPA: tetratricopeptide repeat protein [Pirellulales bacterium]|nr:tetratricopeptide repeat protein [Pirellulales bacterium]
MNSVQRQSCRSARKLALAALVIAGGCEAGSAPPTVESHPQRIAVAVPDLLSSTDAQPLSDRTTIAASPMEQPQLCGETPSATDGPSSRSSRSFAVRAVRPPEAHLKPSIVSLDRPASLAGQTPTPAPAALHTELVSTHTEIPATESAPSAPTPQAQGTPELPPMVTAQVETSIRHGFELAERGAYFSARAEFLQALRTVAQALDDRDGTHVRSQSLVEGLRALDEAESFVPRPTKFDRDINVALAVQEHHTPCLKDMNLTKVTPAQARSKYGDYAAMQLAVAVGAHPLGAQAQYGLGKVYGIVIGQNNRMSMGAETKSAAYYQASLLTVPNHSVSANNLGVMLAQAGRYEEARELLAISATGAANPAVLHNLAVVLDQLGDRQGAARARDTAKQLAGGDTPKTPEAMNVWQSVQFTDPKSFAANGQQSVEWHRPAPQPTARPTTSPQRTANRPVARTAQQPFWTRILK